MRHRLTALTLTAALILGSGASAEAEDAADAASPAEVAAVIADVAPEIADQTTTVTVARDSDSAVIATTEGTTIDVPKDPTDPVTVTTPGTETIAITIEGADDATAAKRTESGTVVYEGTDEQASTAVQATDGGGVRFMTVISGPDAPTEYRFEMDLPEGSVVLAEETGGLTLVNADDSGLMEIGAPWAKDANDQDVPVSYSVEGSTIVMHVEHAGAAYPVVADPWWKPWTWNKRLYNCILWGGASIGVTAISGGAALALVGSGAIGCFAGGASR